MEYTPFQSILTCIQHPNSKNSLVQYAIEGLTRLFWPKIAWLSSAFVGHLWVIPRSQISNNKQKQIHTYIVDCESKGACVTGLRWGARKSTQEVETSRTPGHVSRCITAIWHSRVHIIPAEYHTGCVGLWKVRVLCYLLSSYQSENTLYKYYLMAMCGSSCTCGIQVLFLHHSIS